MADDLPCADFDMLGSLKRSDVYDAIRTRVSDPKPIDAWRIRDENYFVFALHAADDTPDAAAFAMFKMRWDADGPDTAVIVSRRPDASEVEVSDIRNPGSVTRIPLDAPPQASTEP